jgi:hypothetical protein
MTKGPIYDHNCQCGRGFKVRMRPFCQRCIDEHQDRHHPGWRGTARQIEDLNQRVEQNENIQWLQAARRHRAETGR